MSAIAPVAGSTPICFVQGASLLHSKPSSCWQSLEQPSPSRGCRRRTPRCRRRCRRRSSTCTAAASRHVGSLGSRASSRRRRRCCRRRSSRRPPSRRRRRSSACTLLGVPSHLKPGSMRQRRVQPSPRHDVAVVARLRCRSTMPSPHACTRCTPRPAVGQRVARLDAWQFAEQPSPVVGVAVVARLAWPAIMPSPHTTVEAQRLPGRRAHAVGLDLAVAGAAVAGSAVAVVALLGVLVHHAVAARGRDHRLAVGREARGRAADTTLPPSIITMTLPAHPSDSTPDAPPDAPPVPGPALLPPVSGSSPGLLFVPTPHPLAAARTAIGMMNREGIQARNMMHLEPAPSGPAHPPQSNRRSAPNQSKPGLIVATRRTRTL